MARLCGIDALRDPACYPHPVDRVEVRETHISWVLLAGDFAYKVKKPVRLPFADFSSLEARRRFCLEELRLNRRTAPGIYLDVVRIGGEPLAPRIGAGGEPLDYAVRMRRFPAGSLLGDLARTGSLTHAHAEALADAVADFHAALGPGAAPAAFGTAAAVIAPALENFPEMRALGHAGPFAPRLSVLERWMRREGEALAPLFEGRRAAGFVREVHGDLHLDNVVLLDGVPVLFDCIDFSPRLRWTDVMADVAFAFMDFARHGLAGHGWAFLNRYLERTGDYEAMRLLRFYAVYRAVVRAKVALIRAGQSSGERARDEIARARRDLDLAAALGHRGARVLIAMHGHSGSGKTTVSARLASSIGAVRLRSDVERKRLHGLDARARTSAELSAGMYSAAAGDRTYARLAALARLLVADDFAVVVDAAFLERERRRAFARLAAELRADWRIASCLAPPEVLRERLRARQRAGGDASEAGCEVLELQLAKAQPLDAAERLETTFFDTATAEWEGAVERVAHRLRVQPQAVA